MLVCSAAIYCRTLDRTSIRRRSSLSNAAINCRTTNDQAAVLRRGGTVYAYRKLTPQQRAEVVRERQRRGLPAHEPPHFRDVGGWFLLTAATYEHQCYFETDEDREWLWNELTKELAAAPVTCTAWVILPNHYHVLVQCPNLAVMGIPLRRTHARIARQLNRRHDRRGRQV